MEGNVVALKVGFERARSVEDLVALLRALALVEDEGPRRTMHGRVRLLRDLFDAHRTIPTARPVQDISAVCPHEASDTERFVGTASPSCRVCPPCL